MWRAKTKKHVLYKYSMDFSLTKSVLPLNVVDFLLESKKKLIQYIAFRTVCIYTYDVVCFIVLLLISLEEMKEIYIIHIYNVYVCTKANKCN